MIPTINRFTSKNGNRKTEFERYVLHINYVYIMTLTKGNSSVEINVRLIRTSPKSFNFLDMSTGICIFAKPLSNDNFKAGPETEYIMISLPKYTCNIKSTVETTEINSETIIKKRKGFISIKWIDSEESE